MKNSVELGTGVLSWSAMLGDLTLCVELLPLRWGRDSHIHAGTYHINHAGSSGLLSCNQLTARLHLRTLAECLSIERFLWSYSKALLRVPTTVNARIIPGCGHQVTTQRPAWKKGTLLSHKCLVLDHRRVCWALGDVWAQAFGAGR